MDFSFVDQAIRELLRSRKVLSSSYAYGYFLKDCGYNKTIFEYLQVPATIVLLCLFIRNDASKLQSKLVGFRITFGAVL